MARRPDRRRGTANVDKISRGGLRWALKAIVCQHLTVALGVSWDCANAAVLAEGRRVLIADPGRFDNVEVLGVDEHVWRHTRGGDKYVTVIIDLTPVGTERARRACWTWSKAVPNKPSRPGSLSGHRRGDGIEVVAMDGFTGFKTATTQELPDAVAVIDPFHVVRLGGDAFDECRRRTQQATLGHRGRTGDPLFGARRTLHTGTDLLTTKQQPRLETLFASDDHVDIEAIWVSISA